MTNVEYIRNLSDEELANYINAVFIAGKLAALHPTDAEYNSYEVYIDWLHEEREDD